MWYRPYGQKGIIMKMRFNDALPLANFNISYANPFANDIPNVLEDVRAGRDSETLIAKAELFSPEGIPMNNVLFYGIAHNKALIIMVTGIVSVIPNNNAMLPLDMYCPKAYFELRENSVNELFEGNYDKLMMITLRHMLIDFFKMAEMDKTNRR